MDTFLAFCLLVVGCAFGALYEFIRRLERGDVQLFVRPATNPNIIYPKELAEVVSSRNPWSVSVLSNERAVTVRSLIPFSVQCYWGVDLSGLDTAVTQGNQNEQDLLRRRHSLQRFLSGNCSRHDILIPNATAGEHTVLPPVLEALSVPGSGSAILLIMAASPDDAKSHYDAAAVIAFLSVNAVGGKQEKADYQFQLGTQWVMNYHASPTYKLQVLYASGGQLLTDDDHRQQAPAFGSPATNETDALLENDSQQSWSDGGLAGAACVVCQTSAATEAVLPCRHVALCRSCLSRVALCPVCRATIQSHFAVT